MIDLGKSPKYVRLESFGMGPYVMKKYKVCRVCGQILGSRAMLCPICKHWQTGKTLFDVYKKMHTHCPHCSTALTQDARYCPCCGKKVTQSKSK